MTAYRLRLSLPEQIPPRLARTTFYWTAQGRSSFGSTYGPRLGGLGPAPQPNVDFVRIATAVFAADRTEARQFGGSNWNQRDIELTVPVSKVDRWEPLTDQLATLFGFLTGDQWHFRFVAARSARETVVSALPPPQRVVLLSGGADSAIGALLSRSQLQGTESHTLVSHVGLTSMAPIQRRVASQVEALMPGPGQRHIQVTFGRRQKQPNGTSFGRGEPSSRSRSALFLAFGLAVAGIDGVPLWIPENGFASLNPPLGPERRGSLSTRTTHPAFLQGLSDILRQAGAHSDITNPLADMTKGQMFTMAAGLTDPTAASILLSSTHSCGLTGQRTFHVSTSQQCGVCFGCVIRRASFRASGISDQSSYVDPSGDPGLPGWLAKKSVEPSVRDFVRRGIRAADIAALSLPPGYPARKALRLCQEAQTELASLFP
jgi:hypothetical protein